MLDRIAKIRAEALSEIASAAGDEALGVARVKYLGKNSGALKALFAEMARLAPGDRPAVGEALNNLREELAGKLRERGDALAAAAPAPGEREDVTLPGARRPIGHVHPLYQTIEEITGIFAKLGFEVAEGPEVETERNNFDALNIPKDHPSRDAFATFYTADGFVLRSQTSTVQIRLMESRKPPIRAVAPGRVFRPDAVDATHHYCFHQIEGLFVDRNVTLQNLKATLNHFCIAFFGDRIRTRFRPHFFPFTEPSAEMDISCIFCGAAGCPVCKHTGWIEILGSGMVHPAVFEAVGYSPKEYAGFAFGMGAERIAMLKHGIDDIRLFLDNDARFLRQF